MFDAMSDNAPTLLTGENITYADNIPTRKRGFPWDLTGEAAQLLLEPLSAAQILRAGFGHWNASCWLIPENKVGLGDDHRILKSKILPPNFQTMRATGYILLLLGFLWLAVWCAGYADALTRSIGPEHFKKYPDIGKYSGSEVCDAIRSVLNETRDQTRGVTFPAVLMLVGGLLLDVAGRRTSKQEAPETISLEGPVELINDRLAVRIPLAVGGDQLAPLAKGLGKIEGEYLNVTIPRRLAKKLKISAGSIISVDNHKGKFNITLGSADAQPS